MKIKKLIVFCSILLNINIMAFSEEINNESKIETEDKNVEKAIDIKIKKKDKKEVKNLPESNFEEQDIAFNLIIASKYNRNGDFEKTVELLSKINQNSELNDEINTLLSEAYLEIGRKSMANENFEKASKNLVLAKEYVTKINNNFNGKKELEEDINKGLKFTLMGKGLILLKMKKFKEAEIEFTKLIKIDPQNSDFYEHLGTAKFYLGNTKEGIKLVKKSIDISKNKSNASVYYNLACLYSLDNNKELAIKNLITSFKIKPELKYSAIKSNDFNNIKNTKEFKNIIK